MQATNFNVKKDPTTIETLDDLSSSLPRQMLILASNLECTPYFHECLSTLPPEKPSMQNPIIASAAIPIALPALLVFLLWHQFEFHASLVFGTFLWY